MFEETDGKGVDNDQKLKEVETLQLLVSAGYFRARIKGLQTFDKVIGGMTWCIQGCSIDIDIDLLFQDSWNIGKKIALTEKIVKVLKKMNCPQRIEPHQIQGSDFEHIYPVVQWLVRQTFGRQEERMEEMKQMSCAYFDRNTKFKDHENSINTDANVSWNQNSDELQQHKDYLEFLKKCYWPQRKYKKPESLKTASEEVSVISTLFEYGKKQNLGNLDVGKSENDKGDNKVETEESHKKQMKGSKISRGLNNTIQSQMSKQVKEDTKMAGKLISKIIEIKKEDMHEAVEDYQTKSNMLMQSSQNSTTGKIETINKAITNIRSQLEVLTEQSEKADDHLEALQSNVRDLMETVDEKKQKITELDKRIAESVEAVPENIDVIEVEKLVKELDELKVKETTVMASIKEKDQELSQQLEELINEEPVEDEMKVNELQETLVKEKKRLQVGRGRLANKTRELKQLELFLDNIPTKREIQQYQKRFVELNDEINTAYSENKQLFDLYNILDSVKDCLQREVNLLNSIYDNFKEAAQSHSAKEQMIKQMEQVASTIRDLKKNGDVQTEKTKAERDMKKSAYTLLLDQSRQYAKLTKQLQETWQLYDKLITRAQELGVELTD